MTQNHREDFGDVGAELAPPELAWRDRQPYLESRGYLLRPRYRPGWMPSWRSDPSIRPFFAEDFVRAPAFRDHLIDATRLSDGKLVLLKRVAADSMEVKIASYFSSQGIREDPRNHCIPVLDVIPDKDNSNKCYLVMPFLRYVDRPPFESVQSILDCGEQLLEGLVFMHEHGVAHRDCAYKNLMMDATSLYPHGFHPVRLDQLPQHLRRAAPIRSRADVAVAYYLVDFGISSWFQPNDTDRLVLGTSGLDQDVPELSDDVPYDPFKLDIFVLGNFFRQHFTGKFTNLNFLDPLVRQMTDEDPARRPNAAGALRQWKRLSSSIWSLQRLWRPRPRDSNIVVHAVADTFSLVSILGSSISRDYRIAVLPIGHWLHGMD
ncbi:hypothetical protein V8D89_013679 [Ganoderma adspersum]